MFILIKNSFNINIKIGSDVYIERVLDHSSCDYYVEVFNKPSNMLTTPNKVPLLVKLHGDINTNKSIIATLGAVKKDIEAAKHHFIKNNLKDKLVLFMGYSGYDEDILEELKNICTSQNAKLAVCLHPIYGSLEEPIAKIVDKYSGREFIIRSDFNAFLENLLEFCPLDTKETKIPSLEVITSNVWNTLKKNVLMLPPTYKFIPISRMFESIGDYNQALTLAKIGVKYATNLNNSKIIIPITELVVFWQYIAHVYFRGANPKRSLFCIKNAEMLLLNKSSNENDISYFTLSIDLACSYIDLGDIDKGLALFSNLFSSFKEINDRLVKEAIEYNKMNYVLLNASLKYQYEYADALRKAKDYTLSLDYNFKLLDILESLKPTDQITKLFVLNNIGVCYFESGDSCKAIEWYSRCRKEAEECTHWEMVMKCLRNLRWAYLKTGKIHESKQAYIEHQRISRLYGLSDAGPPGLYGNPSITD